MCVLYIFCASKLKWRTERGNLGFEKLNLMAFVLWLRKLKCSEKILCSKNCFTFDVVNIKKCTVKGISANRFHFSGFSQWNSLVCVQHWAVIKNVNNFSFPATSFMNASFISRSFYSVCLCGCEQTNWILSLFFPFTVFPCTFRFRTRMKFFNRDLQATELKSALWGKRRMIVFYCLIVDTEAFYLKSHNC